MQELRDPTPHELFNVAQWIVRLQNFLEANHNWGNIEWCLKRLCNFQDIEILDDIGIDAKIMLKDLSKTYYKEEQYLETSDVDKLKRWLFGEEGKFEPVLKRIVLFVPQTHIKTEKLVSGAQKFIPHEEWDALSELEHEGLDEAARCLLINNYTSAEFVALRSAESVLRRWYEKKTGNKLERQLWGEILEELTELYPKKSERPKELSLLDYLRGRRNEIAHPEAISNPEEATATFLNVIAVCKAASTELLR